MDGEQPTIPDEQAQPAIVENEDDKPRDLQQPEAPEREQETEDDGLDELEFGFKKYRVPKELKSDVEEWRKATTQKEQTVAEQRKALEADRLKQAAASDAELEARAELKGVKAQLEQYSKLTPQDWQYHSQNDPLGTQQAQLQWMALKDRAAQLEGVVTNAASERAGAAQQDLAKRVQETLAAAPKIIPGWKAETADTTIKELVEFAQSEGVSDQVLQDNWSPQFLKLLHRARIGTLTIEKQATAAPKPPPQPTLVPLEKVTGKSTPGASKTLNDVAKTGDMESYVALRKAGRVR